MGTGLPFRPLALYIADIADAQRPPAERVTAVMQLMQETRGGRRLQEADAAKVLIMRLSWGQLMLMARGFPAGRGPVTPYGGRGPVTIKIVAKLFKHPSTPSLQPRLGRTFSK